MKKDGFQKYRTNAYLNRSREVPDVQLEMVTDEILQVVVYIDTRPGKIDGGAWLLALAVDAVAEKLEQETGNPFASFVLFFTAAWGMVDARPRMKRKRSADFPALPSFLGGSSDPHGV